MATNKMLATFFTGKVKSILKRTETANKELLKDTSLEKPIQMDVILSNKSSAYDEILSEYKNFAKKKKQSKDDE